MFDRTAILLLASGLSSRFGAGDKLMADLHGRPVLAHAASVLADRSVARRVAVVGTGQTARKACLEALPPALFRRDHFDQLAAVTGDRGARQIFENIPARQVVAAAPDLLMDIDCGLDLQRAEELLNG